VNYDAWKTATPPEYDEADACVADDVTECSCRRCMRAEDRFWKEQGEDPRDGNPGPDEPCEHLWNGERCDHCDAAMPESDDE